MEGAEMMKKKVGLFVAYGLVFVAVMFAGNQVYAAEISTPAMTAGGITCLATNLSSQTEEATVALYRATSFAPDSLVFDSTVPIVPNQSTGITVAGSSGVYRCTLSGKSVNTRNWRLSACSSSGGCLSGE
jgi:hypothetical protein